MEITQELDGSGWVFKGKSMGKSIGKSHPKTNMDDNYDNWGYPSYLRTPPYNTAEPNRTIFR